MANKKINVLTICPFFITESKQSITCEGIIGEQTVSRFNTKEEKEAHQQVYCTKQYYVNCDLCKACYTKYGQEERAEGGITEKHKFAMP